MQRIFYFLDQRDSQIKQAFVQPVLEPHAETGLPDLAKIPDVFQPGYNLLKDWWGRMGHPSVRMMVKMLEQAATGNKLPLEEEPMKWAENILLS
jgi:hypothetical protein